MDSFFSEREPSALLLKEGYEHLYNLAQAKKEDHCIFTSSGAEAVNHVIFSAYLDVTRKTGKNHFIASTLDERPSLMAMHRLQEMGCVFQLAAPNEQGIVSAKEVAETLSPRTALVSISWVNGLTGVIQPVQEIAEVCKERGILLHVDATHMLGKGNDSFEEIGADFLTFNGEELHGPRGSGALFIRKGLEISPMILGGTEQGHLRAGNFNFALFFALTEAAKEVHHQSDHMTMEMTRLKRMFENKLLEKLTDARVLFNASPRVCHITSFVFPKVHQDSLHYLLNQKGLHASFGGGNSQNFSQILKACKIKEIHSGLSFNFNFRTTEEEIIQGSELVIESVQQLQKLSDKLWD